MTSAEYDGTILINVPSGITTLTILATTTQIKGGSTYNYAFKNAKGSIESVYFEEGCLISTIPEYCFYQCSKLKTVDFSTCSSLTNIQENAFFACSSLSSVSFPASIENINGNIFYICDKINIDSNNQFLKVEENVVFSKNGSILCYCSSEKTGTYTIPNDINMIYENAFRYSKLSSIIIQDNIKQIPNYCFRYSSITQFTFPSLLE